LKAEAVRFLICPACHGALSLEAEQRDGEEVLRGSLRCSCGKAYPVCEAIAEFMGEKYAASFSFQWLAMEDTPESVQMARQDYLNFLARSDVNPERLRGRRVLDAGCGRGSFTALLSGYAQETVGLDLSDGVRVAAGRTRGVPGVTIARGDILNPPLADSSFDAIFSLGVLHHTSDCKAAFLRLAKLLRPGGIIVIWVYSAYPTTRNKLSDFYRLGTTRMPRPLLYALCHVAGPLVYLQEIPVLGLPFRLLPIAGEGNWRWRVLGTFDWYSPKYQSKHTFPEVSGWFKEAGLEDVRVHDWNICVSGRRPPS
jgi:SAM-dependent methyltransferase